MNTREAFEAWWRADGKFRSKPKENCSAAFAAGAAWAARECAQVVNDEDVASTDDPLGVRHVIELHIRAKFPEAFK